MTEFVHGGCTQDGWSKVDYGQEGYGVDYALGADYTANENLKVFPHWTCNTYKITYEMYGMPAANRNDTSYTGPAKITLENAFDPEKKYYFMDSWYKDAAFKTAIRDIQNIDADLTLYARWYNKITYKPGSKVSGAKNLEEKKYFDKTYTFKSSIDKYVRENYTLDGWSLTDGGDKDKAALSYLLFVYQANRYFGHIAAVRLYFFWRYADTRCNLVDVVKLTLPSYLYVCFHLL